MSTSAPVPVSSLGLADLFRLAVQLRQGQQWAPLEAVYREILQRRPEEAQVRFALAWLLLARGDYAEGWPLYEARTEVPAIGIRRPKFSFPEWRGEKVGSILLYPEQGLGDQIMFARYAAQLAARGVRVTMIVLPSLARLFEGLGVEVIVGEEGLAVPRCDAWAMVGSLPRWLGVEASAGYLPGAPGGKGTGVAVRGAPNHQRDAERSLPPDLAAELLARPGAVSLAREDLGASDFEDTRAVIAGLERVVTVDTAVAHLAAAMGKPTWVLLSHDPDWRWGHEGEASAWYGSARLFRQPAAGDWRTVIDAVKAELG
jgi:hypothetical protein